MFVTESGKLLSLNHTKLTFEVPTQLPENVDEELIINTVETSENSLGALIGIQIAS